MKLLMILLILATFLERYPVKYPTLERVQDISNSDFTQIFQRHSFNNTVLIIPVNYSFLKYLEILLCSVSMSKEPFERYIVFQALDKQIESELVNRNESKFGIIPYQESFGGSDEASSQVDQMESFLKLMRTRATFLKAIIDTGFDFIFGDVDTIYLRNPFEILKYGGNADVLFSTDNRELFWNSKDPLEGQLKTPILCFGYFYMKSNHRTYQLIDAIHKELIKGAMNDQHALNYIMNGQSDVYQTNVEMVGSVPFGLPNHHVKVYGIDRQRDNETLSFGILPQTQFTNGAVFEYGATSVDEFIKEYAEPHGIVIHGNWAYPKRKWAGYEQYGWNEFVQDGKCATVNPLYNQSHDTTPRPFKWIVDFFTKWLLVLLVLSYLVFAIATGYLIFKTWKTSKTSTIVWILLLLALLAVITKPVAYYRDFREEYRQWFFVTVLTLTYLVNVCPPKQYKMNNLHTGMMMVVSVLLIYTGTITMSSQHIAMTCFVLWKTYVGLYCGYHLLIYYELALWSFITSALYLVGALAISLPANCLYSTNDIGLFRAFGKVCIAMLIIISKLILKPNPYRKLI